MRAVNPCMLVLSVLLAIACSTSTERGPTAGSSAPRPSGGASGSEHSGPGSAGSHAADEFFTLLRFTSITPLPMTLSEMVDAATLIAVGRVTSVADGRVIDFATGASNPIHTAVLRFEVDRVIKGAWREAAYIEYIRGGITPESLNAAVPNQKMLVMLRPADGWDRDVYVFMREGRGLPEGEALLELVSQDALMIEGQHGIEQPLAHDPSQPLLGANVATLEQAADELGKLAADQ